MIQTQIFNTPTGDTYKPADRIERSLARTGNILEKGIREQYDRDMEQQQQFMSLYSNIGEIEGVLQQQYTGINQQMVDATKNFMAEHYKKGGKATDPEFRMKLGEMTGRLRGGMAQADNNIKQLKPFAEMLKASPYIPEADKPKVLAEVMSLATNPDYLISRNPVDFMSIGKKYERPELILKTEADSFKTNGVVESAGMDAKGNAINTKILMNDFVNRDQPLDEAGRLNTVVPPEYLQKALNGELRPEVLEQYEKIRKANYSNLPVDVGMGMAIQEALRNTMTGNVTVSVTETADQRRRRDAQESRQNIATDLALSRERRALNKDSASDKAELEMLDRWDGFIDAYDNADPNFLQQYVGKGVNKFRFITEKDEKKPLIDAVSSQSNWENVPKDVRFSLIEQYGIEMPTGFFGQTASDSEEARLAVKEALDKSISDRIVGIGYLEKEGTTQGSANRVEQVIPINGRQDLQGAFTTLERMLGTTKPTVKTGEDKKAKTNFKGVPDGGF